MLAGRLVRRKERLKMKKQLMRAIIWLGVLSLGFDLAQAQTVGGGAGAKANTGFSLLLAQAKQAKPFSMQPARHTLKPGTTAFVITPTAIGPNLQVLGGGTLGRVTKWTGFTSSNSFIGDTTIFEDKFGLVGIGTDSPASKLTVAGTIQSLTGGFKFPDGSVATTAFSLNGLTGSVTLAGGANITVTPSGNTLTIAAPNALTAVTHDATLSGNGTAASPLGIANGGVGTDQLANGAVTAAKIASGQVVKGLNGLTDQVVLAAGANITLTPNGNTLTIASATTDPALTAFQKGVSFTIADDEIFFITNISIPANKRLVIEYVALEIAGPDDKKVTCTLTTHLGSDENVDFVIAPVKVDPDDDHGRYTDKQVRIYADGSVHVEISRIGQSGALGGTLAISGHLVNLP
jgi:hypothetical protein